MFLLNNMNRFLNTNINIPEIVLPIGISFFIFQAMSYVFDVYAGDVNVQRNPFDLLLYVALFPQLVAGPIVRYSTVENEIRYRESTLDGFCNGLERFIYGFAKKLIIANQVGALADLIFKNQTLDTSLAWLGAISYMLQIYFDFSAYSDMAIGLGEMFGFHFNENFNYPYASKSITEFWRRWHISLGAWFRDYVYIPLGGNRLGVRRQVLNMFVVWALTGIWHGASWNYAIWGIYFFILLSIEKIFLSNLLKKIPNIFQWLYTMICVLFGWVIFRIDYMSGVISYCKKMIFLHFTEAGLSTTVLYLHKYGVYILLGFILSVPIYPRLGQVLLKRANMKSKETILLATKYSLLLGIFGVSVIYLVTSTYNPFIYFRF